MARVHGRKAFFSIGDINGVVQDISQYLGNISHPETVESGDVTGFGSTDRSYIPGLKSRQITTTGFFDSVGGTAGLDGILTGLLGGGAQGTILSAYVYGPAGSAAGNIKTSGSCFITKYNRTSPVGGAVTFAADFQPTGVAVQGTF